LENTPPWPGQRTSTGRGDGKTGQHHLLLHTGKEKKKFSPVPQYEGGRKNLDTRTRKKGKGECFNYDGEKSVTSMFSEKGAARRLIRERRTERWGKRGREKSTMAAGAEKSPVSPTKKKEGGWVGSIPPQRRRAFSVAETKGNTTTEHLSHRQGKGGQKSCWWNRIQPREGRGEPFADL